MRGRLKRFLIFFVGVFLVVNLSYSIIDLWRKGDLLDKEEERFAKVRLENEELRREYEKLQSPDYIEKEAREKLGLAKEGEAIVVLPPKEDDRTKKTEEATTQKESFEPVWQQWVDLLIK